jgi:hypothetical protein
MDDCSSSCRPGVKQYICHLGKALAAVQQLGAMGEIWTIWTAGVRHCWVSAAGARLYVQ